MQNVVHEEHLVEIPNVEIREVLWQMPVQAVQFADQSVTKHGRILQPDDIRILQMCCFAWKTYMSGAGFIEQKLIEQELIVQEHTGQAKPQRVRINTYCLVCTDTFVENLLLPCPRCRCTPFHYWRWTPPSTGNDE